MSSINTFDMDTYRRQGYCLVKGLFDQKQVEQMKTELGKLSDLEGTIEPGSFVLENNHEEIRKRSTNPLDWIRKIDYPAMSRSAYLMSLFKSSDSGIVKICRQITGEENLHIIYLSLFAKPPFGGSEIPWHQDQALWDLWMNNAVSGWVALSKTTDENGVLQFVPGSNHGSIVPHRQYPGKIQESIRIEDYPDAVPVRVYMEPGDCVFFGGRTWHFSEPNNSPHRRLGMPVVYAGQNDLRDGEACNNWFRSKLDLKDSAIAPLPISADREGFYKSRPLILSNVR